MAPHEIPRISKKQPPSKSKNDSQEKAEPSPNRPSISENRHRYQKRTDQKNSNSDRLRLIDRFGDQLGGGDLSNSSNDSLADSICLPLLKSNIDFDPNNILGVNSNESRFLGNPERKNWQRFYPTGASKNNFYLPSRFSNGKDEKSKNKTNIEEGGERGMYQTREEVIQKLLHGDGNKLGGVSSSSSESSQDRNSLMRHRQWDDTDKFVEDNLQEVYEKLTSLEKQIWGKLIVMEGNKRTAKAYLRHPVITVDGSEAEFDGLRIGLGRFQNSERMEVVFEIFNEILDGIKVKIDPDGNIWAKRMCYSPVFLKPLYRNKPNDLFVIDQRPVKVFDIRRFKEILVQELRQAQPDRSRLEKCCMVCLKFSVDHYDLLRTPCWIVVVHLVAVELLNLVLPKDRDLSSPSSSFVASPHLPPPPPPLTEDALGHDLGGPNGHVTYNSGPPHPMGNYSSNSATPPRPYGRTSRGGVVKRIVRREESPYTNGPMGGPGHAPLVLGEFQLSSGRLPPSGYRSDFDFRFSGNGPLGPGGGGGGRGAGGGGGRGKGGAGGGMATSLLDLRQLNKHYSPVYFDDNNPYGHNRRPNRGEMGERVYSIDALAPQIPHSNHQQPFMQDAGMTAQMERQFRLKKWKSQDSGIGSGSYGSK